jgi:hypothetical protein
MGAVTAQRELSGGDGLDGAEAVALDARNLDEASDGVAGHAEVVLERDLGGVSTCALLPPRAAQRPAEAIAAAEPTSPWQPTSAPEIEALVLMMPPTAAAASRKSRTPCGSRRRSGRDSSGSPLAPRRRRRWSGR